MVQVALPTGRQIYRRLIGYASAYWPALVLGVIGTMIASAADAGFAWMIKPLLDKGFIARDEKFIHWLPFIIMGAFLIRNGANYLSNYYMAWAGRNVVTRFRQDLFAQYMHLPASYLDNTTSGQLLSKIIFNTEQVAKASTDSIVTLVQESCFISGLIFVMFLNSWQLSLLFFVIAPLIAIIARASSKRMRKLSQSIQKSMSEVTQVAEEGIEGYKVIRTFGAQAYEISKFNYLINQNLQREMKTIATNSISSSGVQLVAALLIAVTVYLATAKINYITAGTFTSIIAAMMAMLKPMRNLTNVNSAIQKGIAGAESIFAILDEMRERDDGKRSVVRVQGEVVFDKVNFAYTNNDKLVLQDISFHITPGQVVALVGRSGSGKSTLVSLLPRFYDAYTGFIAIDGMDIRDFQLANLRTQFALVSQHVTLFNDSVARNIAYGCFEQVTEKQIIEAAEAANAMEFIQKLPHGLNTQIGENGVLLSGGQRQRIAIARALLKDAPILILDEATSSLDTESERRIQTALEKLMRNRTTLVVAHRLSTIEKADKILVIDEGKVVEAGTHHELLALNGYYARLHQKQLQS